MINIYEKIKSLFSIMMKSIMYYLPFLQSIKNTTVKNKNIDILLDDFSETERKQIMLSGNFAESALEIGEDKELIENIKLFIENINTNKKKIEFLKSDSLTYLIKFFKKYPDTGISSIKKFLENFNQELAENILLSTDFFILIYDAIDNPQIIEIYNTILDQIKNHLNISLTVKNTHELKYNLFLSQNFKEIICILSNNPENNPNHNKDLINFIKYSCKRMKENHQVHFLSSEHFRKLINCYDYMFKENNFFFKLISKFTNNNLSKLLSEEQTFKLASNIDELENHILNDYESLETIIDSIENQDDKLKILLSDNFINFLELMSPDSDSTKFLLANKEKEKIPIYLSILTQVNSSSIIDIFSSNNLQAIFKTLMIWEQVILNESPEENIENTENPSAEDLQDFFKPYFESSHWNDNQIKEFLEIFNIDNSDNSDQENLNLTEKIFPPSMIDLIMPNGGNKEEFYKKIQEEIELKEKLEELQQIMYSNEDNPLLERKYYIQQNITKNPKPDTKQGNDIVQNTPCGSKDIPCSSKDIENNTNIVQNIPCDSKNIKQNTNITQNTPPDLQKIQDTSRISPIPQSKDNTNSSPNNNHQKKTILKNLLKSRLLKANNKQHLKFFNINQNHQPKQALNHINNNPTETQNTQQSLEHTSNNSADAQQTTNPINDNSTIEQQTLNPINDNFIAIQNTVDNINDNSTDIQQDLEHKSNNPTDAQQISNPINVQQTTLEHTSNNSANVQQTANLINNNSTAIQNTTNSAQTEPKPKIKYRNLFNINKKLADK